jgi:hypothetical protein
VLGDEPMPAGGSEHVLIAEAPAMSDEDLAAAFQARREAARSYNDRLANERARGLRLYNGEPFGDEEEGRSQIVLTEVQDTIAAVMPTIVRVFAGAEHPVEFTPTKPKATRKPRAGDRLRAARGFPRVQRVPRHP